MADYNTVQIDTLYLTDDGTSSGQACLVEIPNLSALRPRYRRTVIPVIGGPPQVQLFDNLIGEAFTMTIFLLHSDEYESLLTIIDTADTNTDTINVKIAGEHGDFDLECLFESISNPPEFTDDRIPNLQITFRVASVNEPEP